MVPLAFSIVLYLPSFCFPAVIWSLSELLDNESLPEGSWVMSADCHIAMIVARLRRSEGVKCEHSSTSTC
jgi:hypothetical protein